MKTIGILGAGQLARMLALAAAPLGIQTLCFASAHDEPAAVASPLCIGKLDDQDKLAQFAASVHVITFENENISEQTVSFLANHCQIAPSWEALQIAQDRLLEKQFFKKLEIPVNNFKAVNTLADLNSAIEEVGYPAVLKTRKFGYDGKGQYLLKTQEDLLLAWDNLPHAGLILEEFVAFEREVSLVAVRDKKSEILFYPLIENYHQKGILRVSQAPYEDDLLRHQAEQYLTKILNYLNYVGVLAVEFFCKDSCLIANEMAPRVHNSGHWTIEGANTSQFENHLRAIAELPLGETSARGHCAMFNCIGHEPHLEQILRIKCAHYHHYSKMAKPARKLAHVNLVTEDLARYHESFEQLLVLLEDK